MTKDVQSNGITRQSYLKDVQYRTPSNLEARINLHRRFSTNSYSWTRWAFDQLPLAETASVLEVGCGPGGLWCENADRLPPGIKVVLGDLSVGMTQSARQALAERAEFHYASLDVQLLPFSEHTFDLAIANHMLYHVPDLQRGIGELARVLKPGGFLCAATNGVQHMLELHEVLDKFVPGYMELRKHSARYCLQNAGEVLGRSFINIDVRRYLSSLVVTEAEPLQAYVLSMAGFRLLEGETDAIAALMHYLEEWIRERGNFLIGQEAGVVLAQNPCQ